MNRLLCLVTVVVAVASSACSRTTITVLTSPPPARRADLDVERESLVISRGVAVALECTEYDGNGYYGPCRDFVANGFDGSIVDVFEAHLDVIGGTNVVSADGEEAVVAPVRRAGVILGATTAGTTTVTFASGSGTIDLDVEVVDAADDAAGDGDGEPAAP